MHTTLLVLAYLGTAYSATGVVEVDLVFPRHNMTYAPASVFPIVVAFQNSKLAPYLDPGLSMNLRSLTNDSYIIHGAELDLRWVNFSGSEVYYEARWSTTLDIEDTWQLLWDVDWKNCTNTLESSDTPGTLWRKPQVGLNFTHRFIEFNTKFSAQPVDLVAATTNRSCSEKEGVAIKIESTQPIPSDAEGWSGVGNECAILASTTTSPNPCQVTINPAAAESITCSITEGCKNRRPDKKSAAPRHAGPVALLLPALIGVFAFTGI
ncbi:hypothetical protein DM02DRAFT_706116 [Periconia macrospinosa]|uniref:DUF7136 domain-containing protein n=1 Tax=Periconia macrospinosa TaxID=97972 RepID=A0A2V1DWU0_9PLEO|nr:hypothetical protein DM02DRAFT_706116 [Periconia macrospinosa]